MTRFARPTRRGLGVAGAGLGLVAIGASTGFVDLVRAGVFALALVVLALLLVTAASAAQRDVRVHRRGPEEPMRTGRTARISVETSTSRSPSLVDTALVEPHGFSTRAATLALPGRSAYDVTPPHRGRFTSGPSALEVRDPLGLAFRRRPVANSSQWIVRPHLRPVDALPHMTPGQGEESTASAPAAQHGEPGASTRPYVRGDDTRLVHWPATAHRGELIIRQFDPPVDDLMRLVLVGGAQPAGADASWEGLIEACASAWNDLLSEARRGELVVDGMASTHLDDGLDALALVDGSTAPDRTPDVATWAFVHTSAARLPDAPRHASADAVVAGDAATLPSLARQLEDEGWRVARLDDTVAPDAHAMSGSTTTDSGLSRTSRSRRRDTAHTTVEGAA